VIDPHSTIRTFLAADSTLTALISARLYAGRDVPPPAYKPNTGPAICFRVRGGAGEYGGRDYEDALVIPSVQFKCYGATEVTAMTCYRTLVDALHNGSDGDILHAEESGIGQPLEESGTERRWRFVLCFFDVMIRAS